MWWYLRARLIVWLLRATGRVIRWAALAVIVIAAAPISIVAAVGLAGAWLRGWPSARLRRAACWSLPMTGVYLAGRALQVRTWQALARRWRGIPGPAGTGLAGSPGPGDPALLDALPMLETCSPTPRPASSSSYTTPSTSRPSTRRTCTRSPSTSPSPTPPPAPSPPSSTTPATTPAPPPQNPPGRPSFRIWRKPL
jgi:hypothetical protein